MATLRDESTHIPGRYPDGVGDAQVRQVALLAEGIDRGGRDREPGRDLADAQEVVRATDQRAQGSASCLFCANQARDGTLRLRLLDSGV
jgi:hypothetical protein